ncbi:MAG: bifunctional methylenetetrahydrofolate dehydrogenase/methenyltetrahydrofolate cyclohydrolase, partial [Bacilli bacterium]
IPCTVKGIIRLLKANNIPLCGKHIVIVGRGNIVGHPLSLALLNENATVTVAHSKTENLKNIILSSDIVISATGIPHLIKEDMISEGTVVVDVGITRENGKIIGDVDFDTVSKKASYITPVPGGVGPMTVAMIIDNIIEIYERKNNNG